LRRRAVLRPFESSRSSNTPISSTTIPVDDHRRSLSSSSSTPKPTSPHGSTISLDSQRRILQRCDELQSYLQVGRREEGRDSFPIHPNSQPFPPPFLSILPQPQLTSPSFLSSSPSMTGSVVPWKNAATRRPCCPLSFS
jgi:hypothetical protein